MRDPYSVLGVSRSADQDTIRKAYKKLARRYHPDLNKDNEAATEKFKEINAAYDKVGDEDKRKLYDQFGDVAFKPGFDAEKARRYAGAGGGFGGFGPGMGGFGGFGRGPRGGGRRGSRVNVEFDNFGFGGMGGDGADGMDMDDLLNMFARGRGAGGAGGLRRGADVESSLEIDLKDALEGAETVIQLRSRRGTPEALKITIPKGIHDGGVIRLRGKGRPAPGGGEPGNLLIKVHIREHPLLKRDGDDLSLEVPISVLEALRGGRIEVPTLEGSVRVKVPAGVANGQRLRLRGKGMPVRGGGRGDMYLVLRPTLPSSDDPRLTELAEEMEALYAAGVRDDLTL